MNNKVNYTLVGLFVLIGIVFMSVFVYWMLKPSGNAEKQKYAIYFDESVSGLNLSAPVKYRGIVIGKVVKLQINPQNSEQVEVIINILRSTPINESTAARLTAQGVTGLTYVNLIQGKNKAAPLKILEGQEYPVIKTVPSLFVNIENSLGNVTTQLSSTLDKTDKLLNEKNQKQFSILLNKTASIMEKVDKLLDEKTVIHLQNSMENLNQITYKVDKLVPHIDSLMQKSVTWENNISHSLDSIKKTYLKMKITMKNMNSSFSKAQLSFDAMTHNVNNTLLQSQNIMTDIQNTLNTFNHNPSEILYKKTEAKIAPGEK